MRGGSIGCVLAVAVGLAGCTTEGAEGPGDVGEEISGESSELHWFRKRLQLERGERIWFDNTYGGEKFFAFLGSPAAGEQQLDVGLEEVINTPRDVRFDTWGVINDPDCEANPEGGPDICEDPRDTGVVGIRKTPLRDGSALFGISCASCHAGFDPIRPPEDPNDPTWENIHPTIGNQHLDVGKIFAANLETTDPRRILFGSWEKGTVDTTLLFNDHINNPGTITAFWNHDFRPKFDVDGDEPELRNGQGGEDDVGGDLAALRVYTNIGVCFEECVAPAVGGARPISIDECRATCDDFPPQQDLDDLSAFLGSVRAPQYRSEWPEWRDYIRGRFVFERECAECHESRGRQRFALSNDEVNPLVEDPENNTNVCRSLTTNWERGRLWAEFSSEVYKERVEAGNRGYRTMPLVGVWSTAPFTHTQSIGELAPATASPRERAEAFERSMWELLSRDREPIVKRLPVALGPEIPAGTPLTPVFSRDPATGEVLCDDVVENRGHYHGSDLSDRDKRSLIEWLKFQ